MRPDHLLAAPHVTWVSRHVARRNGEVYLGAWKSKLVPRLLQTILH